VDASSRIEAFINAPPLSAPETPFGQYVKKAQTEFEHLTILLAEFDRLQVLINQAQMPGRLPMSPASPPPLLVPAPSASKDPFEIKFARLAATKVELQNLSARLETEIAETVAQFNACWPAIAQATLQRARETILQRPPFARFESLVNRAKSLIAGPTLVHMRNLKERREGIAELLVEAAEIKRKFLLKGVELGDAVTGLSRISLDARYSPVEKDTMRKRQKLDKCEPLQMQIDGLLAQKRNLEMEMRRLAESLTQPDIINVAEPVLVLDFPDLYNAVHRVWEEDEDHRPDADRAAREEMLSQCGLLLNGGMALNSTVELPKSMHDLLAEGAMGKTGVLGKVLKGSGERKVLKEVPCRFPCGLLNVQKN
jgi:hypothetical protein